MKQTELYEQIAQQIAAHRSEIEQLVEWEAEQLREAPVPNAWCVLECVEHLNRTYDLYLPRMEKAIRNGPSSKGNSFTQGWIGKLMTKGVAPAAAGERKQRMTTFRFFEPDIEGKTKEEILAAYATSLETLASLLEESRDKNWNRIRVTSAIGPVIRFKLGDCFLFLLAHEARHLLQAREALAATTVRP